MFSSLKNLFHVLKRFKLATVTNLIGLSLAFFLFMLICIHVVHEYGFDSSIVNKERIFQLENQRDDGVWESNFSHPQIERFVAASPHIEAAGIINNLAYSSFKFGVSGSSGPDAVSYIESLDRINQGFTKVFDFDMLSGSTDCLKRPDAMLIPESMSKKLFGDESSIGKPVYLSEFRGISSFNYYGLNFNAMYTVGGVYRDFQENTRVKNAMYIPIQDNEMMDDWDTGAYYCYLLMSTPDKATDIIAEYTESNETFLQNFRIKHLRLRALPELYFGERVRSDSTPAGNKLRTNMLLFIAILIIGIALVNYINLSVALAPVRIKSITTQKVLGGSQGMLRGYLVSESLAISVLAFLAAFLFVLLLKDTQWVTSMLGHSVDLTVYWRIIILTFLLIAASGVIAGLYPAFYITSFPPAMAINGSFSLSHRAQTTRRLLIGFQFIISITLIIGSLFVYLQNKYIGNVDLGFEKDNVLEVKLSLGTASAKSETYKAMLMDHPDIKDVSFNEFKFVTDESRSFIGYNYQGNHSYMSWFGVSPNFPEVMDIKLIAGRYFRPSDEAPDNATPVCMINETAARDIMSHLPEGKINDISELVGTNVSENNTLIQIVGIFKDIHYESLYKEVRPLGYWASARNHYRHLLPQKYSYVKIAGGNPRAAIEHIREVTNELNPGYPAEIRFFDNALDELYSKSHRQGLLVTVLCLLAVILSLVGVFGLVIFESQGREKEIALRKVFGATIEQILWMFNSSFLRVVMIGFVISAPIAYYGVSQWLQGFAYKTPIYLWVFAISLAVIAILTLATVTLQSYRVATSNPAPKLYRS